MRRRRFVAGALCATTLARASDGAPLRLGAQPGPNLDVLEHLRASAAPGGLALRLDAVDDPGRLERALALGTLDAACFDDGVAFAARHPPPGPPLAVAAATVTLPMALYSRRLTTPRALRDGDRIALPSSAPALARALVLLQNFGLLQLRDDMGLHATLADVVANPRALRLERRPERTLFDALTQVPVAVLDYASATRAGLEPARDSIGLEDARSPFAGVLALRRDRLGEPWLARLVAAYRSADTKRFVRERWRDSVRRPW